MGQNSVRKTDPLAQDSIFSGSMAGNAAASAAKE